MDVLDEKIKAMQASLDKSKLVSLTELSLSDLVAILNYSNMIKADRIATDYLKICSEIENRLSKIDFNK